MLKEDLEKRLEDMECKIQELEDMVLDNKLKIMNIKSGIDKEKSGPEMVDFEEPEEKKNLPPPPTQERDLARNSGENRKFIQKIHEPKKDEDDIDSLRKRVRKIKSMLGDSR